MKPKRKHITKAVRDAAEFTKRAQALKSSWQIPSDCRLPDSVAAIEAGRQPQLRQGELFTDSTMARLRAIKAGEGGR